MKQSVKVHDIAARSEGEVAVNLNAEQRSRFGETAWEAAQLLANQYCSEEDAFVAETERLAKGICALVDPVSAPADEVERVRIAELEAAITKTLNENGHLADGDNCMLIDLKRVMPNWKVSDE